MRYSTEPKFRKYVKGYGFLPIARKFGDKHGKKVMDAGTKTGIYAEKISSRRVVQKTAEATGDLIVIKITDKITSLGEPKEKQRKQKKLAFRQKKGSKYLMTLSCFECIKMEFQKIVNVLDTNFDDKDLPRFVTRNWAEVYDELGENYCVNKEIRIKTPMLR